MQTSHNTVHKAQRISEFDFEIRLEVRSDVQILASSHFVCLFVLLGNGICSSVMYVCFKLCLYFLGNVL